MDIPFYVFGFMYGASIGSFYVTLAERILKFFYSKDRKGKTFLQKAGKMLFERSACNFCGRPLGAMNLVPVLGYFFSGRKCSGCKAEIHMRYPLSEFLFGAAFLAFYFLTNHLLYSLVVVLLLGHLLVSAVTDWNYFSLDYENLAFILLFGFLANYLLNGEFPGVNDFFVFLGFLLFYFGLYYFYKKGIGLGDVLFAPVFGFLSSHPWWMVFLNSSYVTAIVFTILFRKKGESLKNTPIPMGVYFSTGLALTFFAKAIYFKMQNI